MTTQPDRPFAAADELEDHAGPAVSPAFDEEPGKGALGQQWHDIQAMFVDDPSGSVQLAAEAADAAVSSLVAALHERQAGLGPAAGPVGDTDRPDTEQLRETLREYRVFCEAVRDLGRQVPQVSSVAR